ncbi:hypothetical protein GXW82_34785 [Streptacidiphilus sp. 4-A2]|nr:hypothetical protein [Streptacidiphilus sp. 4-A2]
MSPQDAHPEMSGVPTPSGAADDAAPPTAPAAQRRAELPESGLRARIGRSLDRTPFRRKLNTLVVVPVVVISVLFGLGIDSEIEQAISTGTQAQLMRDSAQVALLNDDVRAEQQQAILLWTRYDLKSEMHSGARSTSAPMSGRSGPPTPRCRW